MALIFQLIPLDDSFRRAPIDVTSGGKKEEREREEKKRAGENFVRIIAVGVDQRIFFLSLSFGKSITA